MCVPQVVLTSYSYHFPNVMMLAQVVVTSVILEGGRLLGFSSMLKYTLERYYFAQWKGEVTGIYFWVVVYKWGHFLAFLAVCTPKKRVPHWRFNSLHISLLHSCSSQSHAIFPITTQLLFAAWKWKLHFDWLFSGKGMYVDLNQLRGDWEHCVTLAQAGVKEALLYWHYLPNYSFHSLKENINKWHHPW